MRGKEPLVWDFGSAAVHHRLYCDWPCHQRSRRHARHARHGAAGRRPDAGARCGDHVAARRSRPRQDAGRRRPCRDGDVLRAAEGGHASRHVHNMPDVLVFSALVPRLRGAKVLLDLHDPMPELMQSIYGLAADSRAVRLLERLERLSIRFAHAVLTVNQACVKLFTNRRSPAAKINVIMNSPDEQIFQFRPPAVHDSSCGLSKPFVIMYHGSIVERHGLDLAVTALQAVKKSLPLAELRIYGKSTPFLEEVLETGRKSELQASVSYLRPKNLNKLLKPSAKVIWGSSPIGAASLPRSTRPHVSLNTSRKANRSLLPRCRAYRIILARRIWSISSSGMPMT